MASISFSFAANSLMHKKNLALHEHNHPIVPFSFSTPTHIPSPLKPNSNVFLHPNQQA